MKSTEGGKRFVALSAAVAIGLGGVALTAPALATNDQPVELHQAAAEAFKTSENIAAIGHGVDGSIVAQVVAGTSQAEVSKALSAVNKLAEEKTGEDVVVQEVASTYSTDALTVDSPSESLKGEFASHDDVVAGAGYVTQVPGGFGLCSVGFPATGPSGEDAIITAGHCVDVGTTAFVEKPSTASVLTGTYDTFDFDGSRALGKVTHSQFGPVKYDDIEFVSDLDPAQMQDYAVITVNESSGFNLVGEVATWSNASASSDNLASETTPIAGVHDVTTADIGEPVFRSGRTSGVKSGPIGWDESNGNVSVGGIVDGYAPVDGYMVYGFASETEAVQGDSGGTVMMGDQAVGVVSGGIDATGDKPAMLWTAELAMGLEQLPTGYEILTTDEDESPEPTEDPTVDPTEDPTVDPTEDPTVDPTEDPTVDPTDDPTVDPTDDPSATPTDDPSDDADVDAELVVDPQQIAAERFLADNEEQAIAEDRGVTYSVTGVEPGSDVTFDTYAAIDNASANAGTEAVPAADTADAPAKSVTVTADENGNAASRVWGLPTAPAEAYIGDYSVIVTTLDETLNGSFSVVAEDGGNGDGGEDGGNGDDGNGDDLPRTGSTTAPLAAGAAGLVALGGALVYVARRRKA